VACLFCGAPGKMSREHVAPRWIKKLFPEIADVDYERAFQSAGAEIETHRRPGAPFDQTVKDFCEECNTGWMAALERELEPILTPLMLDESASLKPFRKSGSRYGRRRRSSPSVLRISGEYPSLRPSSTDGSVSGRSPFITTAW
jgi:hypothetical protein